MEAQLQKTPYLVGNELTITNVSLYGFAHEGGFNLIEYPAIKK
jgi:glutathione S-transferase